MKLSLFKCLVSALVLFVTQIASYGPPPTLEEKVREYGYAQTVFVIEMVRHGSRAHYEDNIDAEEFFGVPKGHLTAKGRLEISQLGQKRRAEYQAAKKFIAWKWNPNSILSLTTASQRSSESAQILINGMYPLFKTGNIRSINYMTQFTPIRSTSFEYMIESVYSSGESSES